MQPVTPAGRDEPTAGDLPVGPDGADDVELRLLAHPGAPALPLQKGASGGELSRVMLAIEVVFAGVSLSGTSLGPDSGANEKIYGKKVSGPEIFSGSVKAPPAASSLLATLTSASPPSAHHK